MTYGLGGFQDSRQLSIPDAVLLEGNFYAGSQEGLWDYWAGIPVDLQVLKAVIMSITKKTLADNLMVESRYDPYAHSGSCIGLMQLHMDTAKKYGVKNPLNPRENIMGMRQSWAG